MQSPATRRAATTASGDVDASSTSHTGPSESLKRKAQAQDETRDEPENSEENTTLDPETDADFLALSAEQRRRVDEAFDRGLSEVYGDEGRSGGGGSSDGGGGKRRRLQEVESTAAAGDGGFMADDEEEENEMRTGDGDDNRQDQAATSRRSTRRFRLPFSQLPALMASLDLPWDEEVAAVFKSVASLPSGDPAGGGSDQEQEQEQGEGDYTTRRDFRAVCAALMGPEGEEEEEEEGGEAGEAEVEGQGGDIERQAIGKRTRTSAESSGGGFVAADDNDHNDEDVDMDQDDNDSQDEYREDEDEQGRDSSELSLASAYSDTAAGTARGRGRAAAATATTSTTTTRRSRTAAAAAVAPPSDAADLRGPTGGAPARRLTREEKDWVGKMWETMFEGSQGEGGGRGRGGGGGQRMLGKQEIKRWAELLGENWSDQEVSASRQGLSKSCWSVFLSDGGKMRGKISWEKLFGNPGESKKGEWRIEKGKRWVQEWIHSTGRERGLLSSQRREWSGKKKKSKRESFRWVNRFLHFPGNGGCRDHLGHPSKFITQRDAREKVVGLSRPKGRRGNTAIFRVARKRICTDGKRVMGLGRGDTVVDSFQGFSYSLGNRSRGCYMVASYMAALSRGTFSFESAARAGMLGLYLGTLLPLSSGEVCVRADACRICFWPYISSDAVRRFTPPYLANLRIGPSYSATVSLFFFGLAFHVPSSRRIVLRDRAIQLGEMIELFSTQPGKRGLSFDDFSNLLMRGGLI